MNLTPSQFSIAFAHKLARGHADSGLAIFSELQKKANLSDTGGVPLDFLTCLMYGVPAATSLALSIELLLKVHCLQHFGTHPKKHELVEIFSALPENVKDEMSVCYVDVHSAFNEHLIGNLCFSQVLSENDPQKIAPVFSTLESALQYADIAYIKWRYLYENFTSPEIADINFRALLSMVECIENSIMKHKGNVAIHIGGS